MNTRKRLLCVLVAVAAIAVPYVLATASAGTIWRPTADASITWNWQLQGAPSLGTSVQMYDIDGFDNSGATVAALHAQGTIAVCYIDVGTWENWRADASQFPTSVLGSSNGWPGERWLDIRQLSVLAPILTARMQMCVQKGFDALEPDNIDGYTNSTGFPLSAQDQLTFNEWIAKTAHSLGLSVGLKNDVDQASQLEPFFDWSLDEQCNQYSECGAEQAFTAANKAVFNAEYGGDTSFCAADIAAHINGVLFSQNLNGSTYQPCDGWASTAPTTSTSTTASTTVAPTTTDSTTTSSSTSTSSTTTSTTSTTTSTSSTTSSTASTTTQPAPTQTTHHSRHWTTTTTTQAGGPDHHWKFWYSNGSQEVSVDV